MPENLAMLFDDIHILMNKLKKKEYVLRMEAYLSNYGDLIGQIADYVERSEDTALASKEIAEALYSQMFDKFAKRGKLKSTDKIDLSLYMIYYVFPLILSSGRDCAKTLCDAIRDVWRVKFENPEYDYMTYDEVCNSFNNKLFGLF